MADWADGRLGIYGLAKTNMRKIFPDHWSFMLGEICLYSFIIIILTGVYLTLFFHPSMNEVVYDGPYVPLQGIHMSEAYASTVNISLEVRGGLLIRQIHHWAALVFLAGMLVHMMRVFFTGAFRKPREINWLFGFLLLVLGMFTGFTGYSLPDDLLSGTGVRFMEGVMLSIPIVGSYLSMFLYGGEFPGGDFVSRFYSVHVLLLPGIMLGLLVGHLILVFYYKHTQFAGPGKTNKNVVGMPLLPVYMAKAGGFFFLVFGVIAAMAAIASINPIWEIGPYRRTRCRPAPSPTGTWASPKVSSASCRAGRSTRGDTHSSWACSSRSSSSRWSWSVSASTRSSSPGSPGTSASTTSWTARATPRRVRVSASPGSRSI